MKPRQFLIRNSERGIQIYDVRLRRNILMMGRLSGLPIFILTNYNLAASVPRLLQPLIGSQGGLVPLASRGQRPRRR